MRDCLDDGVLQSYFDDELSSVRRENVSAHLASCPNCAAAAQELEIENSLLAKALEPEFDAAVPTARLRERIDSAIHGIETPSAVRSPRRFLPSLSELFAFTPERTLGYAALVILLALVAGLAVIQLRPSGPTQVGENVQPQPVLEATPSASSAIAAATPDQLAVPTSNNIPSSATPSYRRISRRGAREQQQPVARVKLLPGERGYLRTIAALDSTIKGEDTRPMRPSLRAEYERNLALVDRALAAARSAAKNNPNDPDAAEFMFSAYQSKIDLLNTVADARLNNRQQ
ncbi:MAG TPA: zf-HC2 domain-containing protein [Pyrinomonadaceae bacterium]|nr:zf-HC2 domain-containing protein [Pyrinomonadaceae bacterium]